MQVLPECTAGTLVGRLNAAEQLLAVALKELVWVLGGDQPELVELQGSEAPGIILQDVSKLAKAAVAMFRPLRVSQFPKEGAGIPKELLNQVLKDVWV